MSRKYIYNVGDIIETKISNIQILKQIRIFYGKDTYKGYKYKCLLCGNEDNVTESNLKQGVGCNVCAGKKVLKGINDLWTTHPHIAELLKDKELGYKVSKGHDKKQLFICPKCNTEQLKNIYNVCKQGFSCMQCGDGFSYPNKFGFNFLQQLNINFIPEYSPNWISPKRYDFYFEYNKEKYVIEMDGGFHIIDNKMNGQTKEESIEIDKHKDKMVKEHGIEMIRIDCKKSKLEWIKNSIMNSEPNLPKLLNFKEEDIDWLKCHEYACNSLVKIACDYWNNGIRSTKKISKLMNLSRLTITRYLKKGIELKWCDYDPKKEMKNSAIKNKKDNSRKVICLNTKEIFNTIIEAENKYKTQSIWNVCQNKSIYSGILNNKDYLQWEYYEKYKIKQKKLLTNKEVENIIKHYKKVICINTKEIFSSIQEACNKYNINNSGITLCCQGKYKSAGKHPITNEPLKWIYYDEYIKQKEIKTV